MPDSQNKQGEQAMKCAICGTKYSDCNPITNGICGYCEADRRNALRRQGIDPDQPLLSQQHAPSKEVGERIANLNWELSYHVDAGGGIDALEKWVTALRKGSASKSMRITELATELTNGREAERVKHEAQLKAVKEDRDAILDDRDSLRQQLAEAKEKLSKVECDLLPHYAAIKAGDKLVEELRTQNIALSAVVERYLSLFKQFSESWVPGTDVYDYLQQVCDLSRDMLALQPDLSLYGRIVKYLQGGYHVYSSVEASELLTALGQPKPWKSQPNPHRS